MNFKKKLAALLTTAACAVSSLALGGVDLSQRYVNAEAVTGKSAYEITQSIKIGWNLGNTLDATNANANYDSPPKATVTAWGCPEPKQELFDAVKAGGFNAVRIPTTWYQHIKSDGNGGWTVNPEWMAYVKKTVDMAYDQGMYVILNVHHEDFVNVQTFTDATKADAASKLKSIWTQVAEEFKDYDQKLIFEVMNEPRQKTDPNDPNNASAAGGYDNTEWGGGYQASWNYINDLNKVAFDAIRANGSNANRERLIMLPQYDASNNPATVRAINIPDNAGNVALSVHAYSPYYFAMATDEMSNHEYKADGSSASGWGANYHQELTEMFDNLGRISQEKNVPIIIGEFNASDFHNTESRVNWAKDYLSMAKSKNIPCFVWDNDAPLADGEQGTGENHYYISRKTNKWYTVGVPVIKAMMDTLGVSNYSLPEYVQGDFSWNNIQVGDNWVELFKSQEGKVCVNENGEADGWANIDIPGFKNYINKDYKIVLIAKSAVDPAMVLMTSEISNTSNNMGWNYIMQDGTSTQDYVYNFNYDDMKATVEGTGDSMDKVTNLFASGHGGVTTVYGVYAVPVNGNVQPPQPDVFSWDKVSIGGNWIELFKAQDGKEASDGDAPEWGNFPINNGIGYVAPGYDIVMIAESDVDPAIVVQTSQADGWHYVLKDGQSTKYVYHFNYNDMKAAVEGAGTDSISNKQTLCASSHGSVAKVYGVYAVPTGTVETQPTTVEPTESTTTSTTVTTWVTEETDATSVSTEYQTQPVDPDVQPSMIGDVDMSYDIGLSDVITLSKYLASPVKYPLNGNVAKANADVDGNKVVDSKDLSMLIEVILGTLKL